MNVRYLVIAISFIAIGAYFGGIFYVNHKSGTLVDVSFVSGYITLIGGTLATHLGAVFGLNQANKPPAGVAASAAIPVVELSILESAAAWSYIGSLVLAVGLWGWHDFEKTYAEAIRNLALTFPGIIAGVLAVAVNVRRQ